MKLRIVDPETDEPMFTVEADVDTGSAVVINGFQGSTVFIPTENDYEVFLSFVNCKNVTASTPSPA